jgi:hypothetical protein
MVFKGIFWCAGKHWKSQTKLGKWELSKRFILETARVGIQWVCEECGGGNIWDKTQ